ncbi:MAG: hypothetical protein ABI165_00365 [Bryobacteraceae bacterium]
MKTSAMKVPEIEQRDLQRTRYWQGQMLRAGDFRSQLRSEAQLRWWHNRALHNAYGVALGFEAIRPPKKGPFTAVHVEPGAAYDCYGRALILMSPREIPLPDASLPGESFTLVARYRETAGFPDPRQTSGVCFTCCEGSPDRETPEFFWKATPMLRVEDGVPLGRLLRGRGALKNTFRLDPQFIPLTPRPLSRPYLAEGSTIPDSTAWSPWQLDLDNEQTLGIQTVVDTSSAGFTRVPCYFATLDGLDAVAIAEIVLNTPLIAHIQNATASSFLFRLLLPPVATIATLAAIGHPFKAIPYYVRWLGCQSATDADLCLTGAVEKPCCG